MGFDPSTAVPVDVSNLIGAITRVESGGDENAISPQGARGSMQIMPDTFRQYARAGESYDNDTDRRTAAIRKLNDDYAHFGGDIAKTAAAYIGGRGAIRSDGTIRDDVADAHGTTPADYAERVQGRLSKFDPSTAVQVEPAFDPSTAVLVQDKPSSAKAAETSFLSKAADMASDVGSTIGDVASSVYNGVKGDVSGMFGGPKSVMDSLPAQPAADVTSAGDGSPMRADFAQTTAAKLRALPLAAQLQATQAGGQVGKVAQQVLSQTRQKMQNAAAGIDAPLTQQDAVDDALRPVEQFAQSEVAPTRTTIGSTLKAAGQGLEATSAAAVTAIQLGLTMAPAAALDTIHEVMSGKTQTGLVDWAGAKFVDPAKSAQHFFELSPEDRANPVLSMTYAITSALGAIPQIIASGGAVKAPAATTAATTVWEMFYGSVAHGAKVMSPTAFVDGVNRAKDLIDQGATLKQAITGGLASAGVVLATGAIPIAAGGKGLPQLASGAALGVAQGELHRRVNNAAISDRPDLQTAATPESLLQSAVTGAILPKVMGHQEPVTAASRGALGYLPELTPIASGIRGGNFADASPVRAIAAIDSARSVEEAAAIATNIASEPIAVPKSTGGIAAQLEAIRARPKTVVPSEAAEPVETQQPAEATKPVEVQQPVEAAKPVEPVEASQEQRDDTNRAVDALNDGLRRDTTNNPNGIQAVPLLDAPSAEHAAARDIAQQGFATKVHFVADNPLFDGVAIRGEVFLTPAEKHPVLAVTGHEVSHTLEQTDPQRAEELKAAIRPYIRGKAMAEKAASDNTLSTWHAESEVVADLHGAMWLDPKFWGELAQHDPNLFRTVAYKFMETASKAVKIISGSRFDAAKIVNDVDTVRTIIAKAWAERNQARDAKNDISERNTAEQASWSDDGGPAYSKRDDIATAVGRGFRELVRKNGDEAFQYPKLKGDKDLSKTLNQTGIPMRVKPIDPAGKFWRDGATEQMAIVTPSGEVAYVYRYGNEVQLNVSELKSSKSRGTAVYQAVESWTHAHGRVFEGDAQGISQAGIMRRTENMASSILRHGDSYHLRPHPDQAKELGIKWAVGEHDKNLGELLLASYNHVKRTLPEIDNVRPTEHGDYERNGGQFNDFDKLAGRYDALERARVGGAAEAVRPVGEKTLTRAALTGELLRRAHQRHDAELRSDAIDRRITDGIGENVTTKIAYSKKAPDSDLLIHHNLTAENLLHADRIGGIAVPSLAITKNGSTLQGFGEITMIGSKAMADPKGYAGTKVFGADIYSPRYPEINYSLDNFALKRLNQTLAPFLPEGGREFYGSDVTRLDDLTSSKAFKAYAADQLGIDQADLSWPQLKSQASELLRKSDATERIFKGYSNNGDRRYTPHTLENVVKILKTELRGGENFNYGVGSVRSKFTPQFKSIEQIKKAKGQLIDKEAFEKVKADIDAEFHEIANSLAPDHPASDRFGFGDTVSMMMGDAAKMGIPRAMRENGFDEVSQEKMADVADFLNKLRTLPTEYFEAKILRDVDLSEFSGAVIPKNASQKVRDVLKKNGVPFAEYDGEADRRNVIQEFTNRLHADNGGIMFSKKNAAADRDEQRADATSKLAEILKAPKAMLTDLKLATVPMSEGTDVARKMAKDYANQERLAQWQWKKFDDVLVKNFDEAQLEKMWNAADEENDLRREGIKDGARGLGRLTSEERAVVETLHTYGEELIQRAKENGMFDGKGVPYWTPRMAVMVGENGEYSRPVSKGEGGGGDVGRNLTTSASSLKQRKHLTSADTEAAMKVRLAEEGKDVQLVRNIRTMPMAMARLERAIAGRELINQVKALGQATGRDTVLPGAASAGDGYFTLDHPAFKTWRPDFNDDGTVRGDAEGNPVMMQVPLKIANDFKGPLKSVLSVKPNEVYLGMMTLKSKSMGLIMYSPIIHNAVEWGRAIPAMDTKGKLSLGLYTYVTGNRAKNDSAQMREAIEHGLVPIGGRGAHMDITGVMDDPSLKVGKSWTAQVLAAPVALISEKGATNVKKAVDAAGKFWHETLLWDRVADLQMGLYVSMKTSLLNKGMSESDAATVAAHFANRYAGALPKESMSEGARQLLNLTLFSRSFTMGNLGAMKDMFVGLPKDIQAQIRLGSGEVALGAAQSAARHKAIATFIIDVGLMYLGNSLMQDWFEREKIDGWKGWLGGYADRGGALYEKLKKDPVAVLTHPFNSMESLSATGTNEPGKEERIKWGEDSTGTEIYVRLPTGKIGEEFAHYADFPAGTTKQLKAKMSTFLKPVYEFVTNDKGVGQKLYDDSKDASLAKNTGKVVFNFLKAQVPSDQIAAAYDLSTGHGDDMDIKKIIGPLLGLTFSKGAPGGPAVGELYQESRDHHDKVTQIMPDVKRAIKLGDEDRARGLMESVNMTPREINSTLNHIENPESRLSRSALKSFSRHATDEQKDRLANARQ